MRAIIHETFGKPTDVLRVEDRPIPEPGPGEVRIRVKLATIHNHDLFTIHGTYGFKPELPAPTGTEAMGLIDALGPGVSGLEVGQRVATATDFGVWADYAVVKAATAFPVPDAIPDETAAQLFAMPFSAISLLQMLKTRPEDGWIAVNAANGAMGRLIAQIATARGYNVLGLVRRDAAAETLREQGLKNIVSTESEGWKDAVSELLGRAPVGSAIDSVGGAAANDLLHLLARGGELVVFGAMNSPVMELSSGQIIFNDLTVRGFWGKVESEKLAPEERIGLIKEIMQRFVEGSISMPVGGIFDADNVIDAVKACAEPGREGKILLQFG